MTTVVCNKEEMSSDSRASDGSHHFPVDKIFRVGAWLVGGCGTAGDMTHLMEHLQSLAEANIDPLFALRALAEEEVDKRTVDTIETGLVLLSASGIYVYDGYGVAYKAHVPLFAVGSGAVYVFGAYEAAKMLGEELTPAELVKIAIKTDINSGAPVKTLKLKI